MPCWYEAPAVDPVASAAAAAGEQSGFAIILQVNCMQATIRAPHHWQPACCGQYSESELTMPTFSELQTHPEANVLAQLLS